MTQKGMILPQNKTTNPYACLLCPLNGIYYNLEEESERITRIKRKEKKEKLEDQYKKYPLTISFSLIIKKKQDDILVMVFCKCYKYTI